MRGKSGWIRILEATIAVMIVSGVMIAVYSDQSVKEDVSLADYSYSLQNEILDDVAINSSLRLNVLRVEADFPGDPNYDVLDAFVSERIPDSFGHLLRVCDLGDTSDFCKMDASVFIATLDKDVFVEEIVVSAEIGDGSGDEVYSPKKVRLFFWEGGLPADFCRDECSESSTFCSSDSTQVLSKSCEDLDDDGCLDYAASASVVESCGSDELCVDSECVLATGLILTCEKDVSVGSGCGDITNVNCAGYDWIQDLGDCDCNFFGHDCDDSYICWSTETVTTDCSASPSCPSEYNKVSSTPCVTVSASLAAYYDLGDKDGDEYYYDVTLEESEGIAVTISSGRRCFVVAGNCIDYSPSFVIPAGGSIVRSDQYFMTSISDTATYTYYGVDANGNFVEVNFGISTSEYN